MLKKSIFISVLIVSTVAEKRLEFSIYKLCPETFCFALFDAEALKTSTNTITTEDRSSIFDLYKIHTNLSGIFEKKVSFESDELFLT